jgi:hypothetical protein
MLPKFRSFVRPFVHSSYSSFVHSHYPSLIVRSYDYSPSLFIVTIHRHYLSSLFTIVTIHRHYLSSLLFINTIHHHYYSLTLFIIVTIRHCYYSSMISTVTFCHHYSSLLFIDHPITPNFNYSSIMLSSPPKTSQTHIPVIRTPVTVIFLPVGTSHLVTHPRFLQVEYA